MNFIDLGNIPVLEQLQLEESLLRTTEEDYCLVNRGSSPAIVMGISGKPEELVDLERARQMQIPLIKRYSGGGCVVVDENTLFVSFIGAHPVTPCYPEPLMRWSSQFFPHLTLLQNDFVIGQKKVGGNAQYIQKRRFVHHITFLWDYDPEKMACLFRPERTPKYREGIDHGEFLTVLKDHFSSQDQFLKEIQKNPMSSIPPLGRKHRIATREIFL